MHVMLRLFEQTAEELDGAKCYAECALLYKESDRDLADMYINLARTEMDHYARLKAQATRLANAKLEEHEVPTSVQEVYDWYNTKLNNKMAEVKILIESYK